MARWATKNRSLVSLLESPKKSSGHCLRWTFALLDFILDREWILRKNLVWKQLGTKESFLGLFLPLFLISVATRKNVNTVNFSYWETVCMLGRNFVRLGTQRSRAGFLQRDTITSMCSGVCMGSWSNGALTLRIHLRLLISPWVSDQKRVSESGKGKVKTLENLMIRCFYEIMACGKLDSKVSLATAKEEAAWHLYEFREHVQ